VHSVKSTPRFPRGLALYNGSSPVIPANDPPEVERPLWRLGPIGRLGGPAGGARERATADPLGEARRDGHAALLVNDQRQAAIELAI
jgi:hypothetical protein